MADVKGFLQPCRLCSVLKGEIELCQTRDEGEREAVLSFLLKGHQEACHGSQ